MNSNIRLWFFSRDCCCSPRYVVLSYTQEQCLYMQMLFFGTRCERLCMIQFSLISLIPGLINSLQDCADPSFDTYSQTVEKPTSLKTSDKNSCMVHLKVFDYEMPADPFSAGIHGLAVTDFRKGKKENECVLWFLLSPL